MKHKGTIIIGISFFIRSEYLKLREAQYVEVARALGVKDWKIMFRHILPNALTPIITFLPFDLIGAIFSLSSLDFLGFGLPALTSSWGELMRQGMGNLSSYWLSIYPALALFGVLLLIAFVGEGIREAYDPKEFQRMEKRMTEALLQVSSLKVNFNTEAGIVSGGWRFFHTQSR